MNTNEIRKITGLSVQMIHFYEKKKIIKPVRNESNGYRNFTAEDEFRIVIAHTLNSMGIALDDVCQIMDGSNYDEKISMLQDRIAVMKKKRKLLDQQLELAGELADTFEAIRSGVPYILRHYREMYYYPARSNPEYSKLLRDNGPGIEVLRVQREYFTRDSYPKDTGTLSGTHIPELDPLPICYQDKDILEIVIRTPIARVPGVDTIRKLQQQILNYGYLCTGDCFIHSLCTDWDAGKDIVSMDFTVTKITGAHGRTSPP